jgi:hypothetical protein
VINRRFQGVVEKICKTHAIVLAKLIKLRVRSEKGQIGSGCKDLKELGFNS